MAVNFKVMVYRVRDNLHLRPVGDFDGSSALELINAVEENGACTRRVFIHTNGLREVHPFGKAVFRKQFSSTRRLNTSIVFLGKQAEKIVPDYDGFIDRGQMEKANERSREYRRVEKQKAVGRSPSEPE